MLHSENATAPATRDGGATMTREPSTERQLDHLEVELDTGNDLICRRCVCPVGGATLAEIVAAMQDGENNDGFLEVMTPAGNLYTRRGSQRVVLATFHTEYDGLYFAEIASVTACFDDDTETEVPLT